MLSKRIIACLDVRDGQVVKGVNFEGLRSAGDPAELARRYNREGIDELVILDITADRAPPCAPRACAQLAPLAVGGGIHQEDAAAAVDARQGEPEHRGAQPVIIHAGERYGSQAVLVAIDSKWEGDRAAVYAQRQDARRSRRRELGQGSRGSRRRRNPADLDRPRRHQGRLRLPADRGGPSAVSIPVIASGGAARSTTSPRSSPPAARCRPRRVDLSLRETSVKR